VSRTRVVFLGEDPRDPLQHAAADYLSRARVLDAQLVALAPAKRTKGADDARVKRDEGARLLAETDGCTRVALDPLGKAHASSEELAAELQKLVARGKPLAFLIGGATGLDPAVMSASDARWSLSRLTYAHRLAVLVLCEQLYRATEIWRGGPYHK
jgi:23S rRNA (pseudouridine1915-N3)-methyltransferase